MLQIKNFFYQSKIYIFLVSLLFLSILSGIFITSYYNIDWDNLSGFYEKIGPVLKDHEQYRPAKNLWDWMTLFIVPVFLAAIGLLFALTQNAKDQRISEENIREATLRTYIDQISELLLDHQLRTSAYNSEVRDIARTRTLVVLGGLDPIRKGIVLRFLQEAKLVGQDEDKLIVDLRRADFRLADLRGQDLSLVSLVGTFLEGSDLSACTLTGTDLRLAKMRECKLSTANLSVCNFQDANLDGANLSDADLQRADLRKASLKKANLQGASLRNADLREANLCGANLTDAGLAYADLKEALYDSKTKFPRGFILPKDMILSE